MKRVNTAIVLALLLAPAPGVFAATTVSSVRFKEAVTEEDLSAVLGMPVSLRYDTEGTGFTTLPDAAVRQLKAAGVPFEVLSTRSTFSELGEYKTDQSVSATNSAGFAINLSGSQTLPITSAPAGAVVTSVTLRVKGIAAYADLCWFQLRDAANKQFTLPKWYDEIWFDHTVTGITAFNGRPVNQAWTLCAEGSNTAGERVEQWWITIYYTSGPPPPPEGEGEYTWEGEGEFEGEEEGESEGEEFELPEGAIPVYNVPCSGGFPYPPMELQIQQFTVGGEIHTQFEVPLDSPPYNPCGALQLLGIPYILVRESTKRVELHFTPTLPIVCTQEMNPQCSLLAVVPSLTPGQWRFVSAHDGTNSYRPNFNVLFTVTAIPIGQEGESVEGELVEGESFEGEFVVDKPPTITLMGPNPLRVECGTMFIDPGVTAEDREDGDLTDDIVISGGTVNVQGPGTYIIRYYVTDSQGNEATPAMRTVIVQDTTPPMLTLIGEDYMKMEVGNAFTDPGAVAEDSCGPFSVSDRIMITGGPVDTKVPGTYTLTYQVADNAGNTAKKTRTVQVWKDEPPVITLKGTNPLAVECGGAFTDPGAMAMDTPDGNLSTSIKIGGDTVDTHRPGTCFITYDVTDSGGKAAATVTREVIVSDTQKPTITLLGANPLKLEYGDTYTDPGATALDACVGDLSGLIVTGGETVNTTVSDTYMVRYTVTDHSENECTAIRQVVVLPRVSVTVPNGT